MLNCGAATAAPSGTSRRSPLAPARSRVTAGCSRPICRSCSRTRAGPVAAGEPAWTAPLREAHAAPVTVARRLRDGGTPVVGVVGRAVPRELVIAAGMHPLRIAPRRLPDASSGVELPPGLETELAPGML